MIVLAALFGAGLVLSLAPWKRVAIVVCAAGLVWLGYSLVGYSEPLGLLSAPALLLGWAMGLLIRRTIAERKAS